MLLLEPLEPHFFRQDTVTVARGLLGKVLCRDTARGFAAGVIVETEAYLSKNDPACHASRGRTKRNSPMFGSPGRAYVYFIYGSHYCFNVVTGPVGNGEAVLVRALEPLAGLTLMEQRRGSGCSERNLAGGPGKLCQALAIDLELNEHDLMCYPLWITARGGKAELAVVSAPRIGISQAADKLLRFYIAGNKYVSRRAPLDRDNQGTRN